MTGIHTLGTPVPTPVQNTRPDTSGHTTSVPPEGAERLPAGIPASSPLPDDPRETGQLSSEPPEKEKRQELLENVIAVSEDGDTLQVSDETAGVLVEATTRVTETGTADTGVSTTRSPAEENFDTSSGRSPVTDSSRTEEVFDTSSGRSPVADPSRTEADDAVAGSSSNSAVSPSDVAASMTFSSKETGSAASSSEETDQTASALASASAPASEPDGGRSETGSVQSGQEKTVTSFAGYTSQQLKQLYQDGAISRYKYENEIDRRKEVLEEQQQTAEEDSRQMTGIDAISKDTERMGDALVTAFSDKASSTISPGTRMDVLENLELPPKEAVPSGGNGTGDDAVSVSF